MNKYKPQLAYEKIIQDDKTHKIVNILRDKKKLSIRNIFEYGQFNCSQRTIRRRLDDLEYYKILNKTTQRLRDKGQPELYYLNDTSKNLPEIYYQMIVSDHLRRLNAFKDAPTTYQTNQNVTVYSFDEDLSGIENADNTFYEIMDDFNNLVSRLVCLQGHLKAKRLTTDFINEIQKMPISTFEEMLIILFNYCTLSYDEEYLEKIKKWINDDFIIQPDFELRDIFLKLFPSYDKVELMEKLNNFKFSKESEYKLKDLLMEVAIMTFTPTLMTVVAHPELTLHYHGNFPDGESFKEYMEIKKDRLKVTLEEGVKVENKIGVKRIGKKPDLEKYLSDYLEKRVR